MSRRRFYATRGAYWWVIVDRDHPHGERVVRFAQLPDTGWPTKQAEVRAWARALSAAAADAAEVSAAAFELARLTGQPTAVTREVVADILDGDELVHVPRDVMA